MIDDATENDATRNLAFAMDGTYVETTNKRVAELLAVQESSFIVDCRQVNGRTMYRIR
jgi:hypothetical protein